MSLPNGVTYFPFYSIPLFYNIQKRYLNFIPFLSLLNQFHSIPLMIIPFHSFTNSKTDPNPDKFHVWLTQVFVAFGQLYEKSDPLHLL